MAKCISNSGFRQCIEDLCLEHSMKYGYVMIESSPPDWQSKIIPGKAKIYMSLTNQNMGDTFITSDRPSSSIKEQLDHWRAYVIANKWKICILEPEDYYFVAESPELYRIYAHRKVDFHFKYGFKIKTLHEELIMHYQTGDRGAQSRLENAPDPENLNEDNLLED